MRTMITFFLGAFGGVFVGLLFAAVLFADRGVEQASAAYKEVIREYVAENAKLRERVAKLDELLPENGRWFRAETVEAYVAEIAKLRKLVSNCHGWLAVNCEKGYAIPRNGLDAIEQSMHELGIEVGE